MYDYEYEIVEYKKKLNWKRVIFVICALLIVIFSVFLGIKCAKEKNNMQGNNNQTNTVIENSPKVEATEVPTHDLKEIPSVKKNKIPIYTETGKENVKKVYTSTPESKRVFLTFDDGPSNNVTPLILDVLKDNNIKATFFTLGYKVEQNPSIVKRAYEEGHYIANHGYSHNYSSIYASEQAMLNEYNKTEELIRNAIEVPEYSSHLFRFPGGSIGGPYNSVKKQYVKNLSSYEIYYVDWNCLNEDATGNRTKEQLVQYIKETSVGKNSVVVLMHDAGDKILTYETLQEIIDYFKANEYTFYNFYDLIEYEVK